MIEKEKKMNKCLRWSSVRSKNNVGREFRKQKPHPRGLKLQNYGKQWQNVNDIIISSGEK